MAVVIKVGMRHDCVGTVIGIQSKVGVNEYKIQFADNRWGWYLKAEFEFVQAE